MKGARTVAALVWLALWVPAAVADASFQLERADGERPARGMNIAPLIVGAKTIERYFEAPRPAVRAQSAVYRPSQIGKCYTEPGTPPSHILRRESRGDPRIWNRGGYSKHPRGSTASGCWQFIRGTWGGYKGYANAADAPVHIQNERAKQVWAGGRGCSHWSAC